MRTDFQLLLFDLDDTLIDRVAMFRAFLKDHIREYFPHHVYENDLEAVLDQATIWDYRSYTPREDFFRKMEGLLGARAHSTRYFGQHWAAVAGSYSIAYPETAPALLTMRRKYPIAVLTNGPEYGQNYKVDGAGLRPLLDRVFTSEELGAAKPKPEAFYKVCAHMNVKPQDTLYIGDYYKNDVEGAMRAGLTAVYIDRGDGDHHEYSIDGIGSLPALLGLSGEGPCA